MGDWLTAWLVCTLYQMYIYCTQHYSIRYQSTHKNSSSGSSKSCSTHCRSSCRWSRSQSLDWCRIQPNQFQMQPKDNTKLIYNHFTHLLIYVKLNLKQLNPDSVAFYDIRPGTEWTGRAPEVSTQHQLVKYSTEKMTCSTPGALLRGDCSLLSCDAAAVSEICNTT